MIPGHRIIVYCFYFEGKILFDSLDGCMARKGQPIQIKAEPSVLGTASSEQSSSVLLNTSSISSTSVDQKAHMAPRNQSAFKRMKATPGVTITHLDAIGEYAQGKDITPHWLYPAVNQIVAPIFSKLTEIEQRISGLDARQADLEARLSDHKSIYIARLYSDLNKLLYVYFYFLHLLSRLSFLFPPASSRLAEF
jgi:hypothetical protein